MARLIPNRVVLLMLSFSLLGYNLVSARAAVPFPGRYPNEPAMIGPEGATDADFAVFRQTFREAVDMARYAAMYFPCDAKTDDRFLRYFRPEHADFVKNMYRAVANIPLDLDLSDKEALQKLIAAPLSYTDKFKRLSISFLRDHPGQALPDGPGAPPDKSPGCGKTSSQLNGGLPYGYTIPLVPGKNALMTICGLPYQHDPMLDDIIYPPFWAVDLDKSTEDEIIFETGYSCENDNIPPFDNSDMKSPAHSLLHELFHWRGLFEDVPDYEATIATNLYTSGTGPGSGLVFHEIVDWTGGDPPLPANGYGAYNTRRVNELEPYDKRQGTNIKGIFNADNYAWYAVSTYFTQVCKKDFKECPDEDSAELNNRHFPPWPFDLPKVQ